jgi:hypothetical protein
MRHVPVIIRDYHRVNAISQEQQSHIVLTFESDLHSLRTQAYSDHSNTKHTPACAPPPYPFGKGVPCMGSRPRPLLHIARFRLGCSRTLDPCQVQGIEHSRTHMHAPTRTHKYTYNNTYTYTYTPTHACTHACMHTCTHAGMHAACTHAHTAILAKPPLCGGTDLAGTTGAGTLCGDIIRLDTTCGWLPCRW